jgi:putative addiction module killer protein
MYDVRSTQEFNDWLGGLRDRRAKARIAARLFGLAGGLVGDAKSLGKGLSELRIDEGPGYRVYFVRRGSTIIVLLCAGDKSSQTRDISRARELFATLEE